MKSAMEAPRRIALCPEGTRGDVQPLVALGEQLAAKGHEIVLCAPPGFEAFAQGRAFEFREVGSDAKAFLSDNASAATRSNPRQLHTFIRYLEASLDAQFQRLAEATSDVDHIVGAGAQAAGPSCAELHGLTYEYVIYCPNLLRSPDVTPFYVPGAGWGRVANRLSWTLLDVVFSPIFRRFINRRRARLGLAPVRDIYRHLLTDVPRLAADEELAPIPAELPHEVVRLGFLYADEGDATLSEDIERFLEAGPPPVYIGFGSMPDPNPIATTQAIVEAAARTRQRVLIGSGWAELGRVALPTFAHRAGSLSHAALFPRCSLVIHHGGAGSTHTAFRARAPQRIVPHLLDQFYWQHRVATLAGSARRPPRRKRLARELGDIIEEGIAVGGPVPS